MDLLWAEFLNSLSRDWRGTAPPVDQIEQPDWLSALLERWNLSAPVPLSPPEAVALRALRGSLLRISTALSEGESLTPHDLAELNRTMGAGPVVRTLEAGPDGLLLRLLPERAGWTSVMAQIVASFAETITQGEPGRLRFCENPDCRWAFYDETRNRAKRFCDDKLCGNLMKVRRFRARKKATHHEPPE